MIDEQLIAEVEQHGVIYNRQKYCINMAGSGSGNSSVNKYETKDEAWQIIAMKLRSDVETCKKRWKYLRERYVSQRKQGDPPVYEHLSRPYLEKMKFLDQHIQPRKSYRNVSNFLTSPNASSSFCEYNMDSSKSNSSIKNPVYPTNPSHQPTQPANFQQDVIKTEEDQTFRDFAAAVASSQQLQQINPHHSHFNSNPLSGHSNGNSHQHSANVIPGLHQTIDSFDQYRQSDQQSGNDVSGTGVVGNGIASSTSSSMKSPLSSSPPSVPTPNLASNNVTTPNDNHQFIANGNNNMKKPRVQKQYLDTSDSDDNASPASTIHHSNLLNNNHAAHLHQSHQHQKQQQQQQFNKLVSSAARNMPGMNHQQSPVGGMFQSNNDFLFSLYQQMSPAAAAAVANHERNTNIASTSTTRSSEHLLGELVTSELLKMNRDRRKIVQKKILEILFFED